MSNASIESLVHRNLDAALAGGYGDDMREMTDGELTLDLLDKCAECESLTVEQVYPCVTSWRALHVEVQRVARKP
jgi:hypothetical protein